MCKCNAPAPQAALAALPPAVPGEAGFTTLAYTGAEAKTEYGPVTGARYPFGENPVRLVDCRDAERMKTWEQNGARVFQEAGSA